MEIVCDPSNLNITSMFNQLKNNIKNGKFLSIFDYNPIFIAFNYGSQLPFTLEEPISEYKAV
jgi:hypothetical protein